ncbi:hypothetical protein, partial [Yanghanlia caeni]|nr:hypothetical protein [Alcaligenaceae bacterium LG-2]
RPLHLVELLNEKILLLNAPLLRGDYRVTSSTDTPLPWHNSYNHNLCKGGVFTQNMIVKARQHWVCALMKISTKDF